MSLAFYNVLHVFGVIVLFTALGGLCALSISGADSDRARKLSAMLHGIALVIILVAGFGQLARLGFFGVAFPLWIWLKLAIWVVLGAATVIIRRMPQHAAKLYFVLPLLGGLAAYLAIYGRGTTG